MVWIHADTCRGESGSGKTEAYNNALKALVAVSKSKRRDEKTSRRILSTSAVLEAFGTAKTIQNDSSSRFGKVVEVQFNSRGRLAGLKIMDYLLERPRVAHVQYSERNFNVFYYMLAGLSSEERAKWNLLDPHKYVALAATKGRPSATDVNGFAELKTALKVLGFKDKYQSQIFQLLSAILHLGNVQFEMGKNKEEAAKVKNYEALENVAELLGLRPTHLENALVYKTKLIKKELCTMFLDPDESSEQRHLLMQTLYSLLWSWVVEAMNKRLDQEEPANVVTLVDMFGIDNLKANYFHQLLYNYTFEKLLEFTNKTLFDAHVDQCKGEGVGLASVSYSDNSEILKLFTGTPSGVLTLLNEEAAKGRKKAKISTLIETWNSEFESNKSWIAFPKKSKSYLFGIRHHVTDVNYDAAEFVDNNSENISADFVTLFRGGPDTRPSKNTFIQGLFTERALNLERNPQNSKAVVGAMQTNSPRRKPSVRRPKKGESSSRDKETAPTFASHYQDALNLAFECLNESELSFVYCLRSNGKQSPSRFETTTVTAQVSTLGLSDVVSMRRAGYGLSLPFDQFVERYRLALSDAGMLEGARSPEKALRLIEGVGLSAEDALMGQKRVFLTDAALRLLTFKLRRAEKAERKRLKEKVKVSGGDMLNLSVADGGSQVSSHVDEEQSDWNSEVDDESQTGTETVADDASNYGSEYSYMSEAEDDLKKGAEQELDFEEEEEEISGVRRWWLRTTTFLTWWIPSRCLEWNGMKRADIQQAWREKLALCILIFFLSAVTLFFITGFSLILCPRDDLYDLGELSNHNDVNADLWMAVWGSIYDVTVLRRTHSTGPELMDDFAGQDASECFLLDPSLCGLEANPLLTFNSTKCWNHDLGSSLPILNPKNRRIWKGYLAHRKDSIARDHGKADSWWIINDGNVYDMTNYRKTNQKYLGDDVTSIVYQFPGSDATAAFKRIGTKGRAALNCMNKIHFVGKVDTRDSPQCLFANTLLLAATGVLVGITVIKFLSALQLGSKGDPEDHDRFVICMVPCYTEGEESLRRTIDSLATLRYDDKRKLLMLVADGNIIGSGNDRATWRIALDLLGVDPTIDPPKLSFQSLGEGNLQHNMGKVYTGLYDCSGHLVPYMVVVKVGKDNETRRPGNRGKRDSQMVLMRFLQKVHYDESMSPLELEMYHQMKNVIGVDPSFYEFVLMVDADTEVVQDSLNRMISFMVHDAKVLGLCGETLLANEKGSVITMVQVYEYYISHHLAKAFESLFGSVTCLPGCFCMYRIRSPNKSIPLLIAKPVISDYGVNNVDTLHKKNLLSLGEDRYLTTLMLKHFPNMKISFTPHAQAKTYAPDRWSILLSQRRRWINSTIHNLAELLLLPQLCGFCCFSMRFVVFFDLFATLVMPATMAYLAYLIYEAIRNQFFPLVSLIMLCVAYGLQIIIFLLRGKFEHIGWLVIYLLALPFFTFIIPMYSFWHFDDFSWGNTRVVVGERGGKKQIIDEEPFDPSSIPMKRWSDYEQEMWEEESKATSVTKPHQPEEYAKSAFSHHTRPAHSLVGPIYPPAGYPVPPEYAAAMYQQQQMPVPGEIHSQRSSVIQPVRPVTMISSEEYPTNEQIVAQVKTILSTADLMTVTKKQVRDELSMFFGVDMTSRKEFINKVIEDVLQGKM